MPDIKDQVDHLHKMGIEQFYTFDYADNAAMAVIDQKNFYESFSDIQKLQSEYPNVQILLKETQVEGFDFNAYAQERGGQQLFTTAEDGTLIENEGVKFTPTEVSNTFAEVKATTQDAKQSEEAPSTPNQVNDINDFINNSKNVGVEGIYLGQGSRTIKSSVDGELVDETKASLFKTVVYDSDLSDEALQKLKEEVPAAHYISEKDFDQQMKDQFVTVYENGEVTPALAMTVVQDMTGVNILDAKEQYHEQLLTENNGDLNKVAAIYAEQLELPVEEVTQALESSENISDFSFWSMQQTDNFMDLPNLQAQVNQPAQTNTISAVDLMAQGYELALKDVDNDPAKFVEALKSNEELGLTEANIAQIEEAVEVAGTDGQKFALEMQSKNQQLMTQLSENLQEMAKQDAETLRRQADADQVASGISGIEVFMAFLSAFVTGDMDAAKEAMANLSEKMKQDQAELAAKEAEAKAINNGEAPAEKPEVAEAKKEEPKEEVAEAKTEELKAEPEVDKYAETPEDLKSGASVAVEKPADTNASEAISNASALESTNQILTQIFGNNVQSLLGEPNVTVRQPQQTPDVVVDTEIALSGLGR